jgi:hypothetical protein
MALSKQGLNRIPQNASVKNIIFAIQKKYDHFLAPWQKPTGLGLERSIW